VYLDTQSGRGVRVAVVDSGVYGAHPHVAGVAGGIAIHGDGRVSADYVDRLGHGTAVAAAIKEKAPDCAIFAIRIFWSRLATDIDTLARAIAEAANHGSAVINLSLGTAELNHRERLQSAVLCARRAGAIVVAARDDGGVLWLPGSLDEVIGVRADATLDRNAYCVQMVENRPVLVTSPYPRDIPGVPRERNLNGVSFAVANASGFVARALEMSPGTDIEAVFAKLQEATCAPIG
jgi:Subtilase family